MINAVDKLALFDFCETLVSFQSADRFVEFTMRREHITGGVIEKVRRILCKTKLMRILQMFSKEGYVNKRILLKNLTGLKQDTLESNAKLYYEEDIKPNLIQESINRLKILKKEGYEICVVSAGYDIYLKYFCKEFGIDSLLCTKLLFCNDIFTGRYEGKDIQGQEKVKVLRKKYKKMDFTAIDSIAFTDSASDLPMIRMCRKGVVVKKFVPKWAEENKLEVLRWA